MTADVSRPDGAIDAGAVRGQLERILASPGFAGSARIRRFLQFVVDRQLAGEGSALKEFAMGVEVFDRPANYDPRLDAIVRVEAGRLRSKLEEYYTNGGLKDEIRIGLPRGSYVPVFERKANSGVDSRRWTTRRVAVAFVSAALLIGVVAGWASLAPGTKFAAPGISIAVLPFEQFTGSDADLRVGDQITDEVTTALARLGSLSVVSRASARQFQGVRKPMHEMADALGAQFVMESSLELIDDTVEVQPRIVDAAIDRKIWVGTYRGSRKDLRELATRIAADASTAILGRAKQK